LLRIRLCFRISTEQSESAPAVTAPQVETLAAPASDHTASNNPKSNHAARKNPKCVAAGKMVAERTRLAREQQKKAAEAYDTGKNKAKAATEAPDPPPKLTPTTGGNRPKSSGLSTNQWIAIGSIGV